MLNQGKANTARQDQGCSSFQVTNPADVLCRLMTPGMSRPFRGPHLPALSSPERMSTPIASSASSSSQPLRMPNPRTVSEPERRISADLRPMRMRASCPLRNRPRFQRTAFMISSFSGGPFHGWPPQTSQPVQSEDSVPNASSSISRRHLWLDDAYRSIPCLRARAASTAPERLIFPETAGPPDDSLISLRSSGVQISHASAPMPSRDARPDS